MEDIQLYFHCPEGWDDGKNSPTETNTTSAVGQAAEVNEIDHRHVTHVYLLKYSQATLSALSTGRSFAEAVSHQITAKQQKHIPLCPKCFSSLIRGTN